MKQYIGTNAGVRETPPGIWAVSPHLCKTTFNNSPTRTSPSSSPAAPFGGHKTEYKNLLEKRFTLKTLAPCYNSIKPRAGTELFFIAIRP
ncbi:hypothetical protein [Puia dinghuensis]|uniref:hypothetical protein n=1 Tax=Puia dinghuensis TaxID=1792502 RepID=UPI001E65B3C3|nr:hypothetical protein [Puia dinghuensis]